MFLRNLMRTSSRGQIYFELGQGNENEFLPEQVNFNGCNLGKRV